MPSSLSLTVADHLALLAALVFASLGVCPDDTGFCFKCSFRWRMTPSTGLAQAETAHIIWVQNSCLEVIRGLHPVELEERGEEWLVGFVVFTHLFRSQSCANEDSSV